MEKSAGQKRKHNNGSCRMCGRCHRLQRWKLMARASWADSRAFLDTGKCLLPAFHTRSAALGRVRLPAPDRSGRTRRHRDRSCHAGRLGVGERTLGQTRRRRSSQAGPSAVGRCRWLFSAFSCVEICRWCPLGPMPLRTPLLGSGNGSVAGLQSRGLMVRHRPARPPCCPWSTGASRSAFGTKPNCAIRRARNSSASRFSL